MRRLFTLDPHLIYLNSGTHSICPDSVLAAAERYRRQYELNPTAGLLSVGAALWTTQQRLGRFLGARPEDLYLRANVTEALNEFILGMPLPAGSEIVVTSREYGAVVNLCRFRAERDHLSLRTIEIPDSLGPTEVVPTLISGLRPNTSLLVTSHVFTGDGLVLSLRELAAATRQKGVLLAIDGAHAPGAVDINFAELEDLDCYGGNLHKWFMAPKGTGFGWVHPRHQETLQPISAGWPTYDTPDFLQAFAPGHRFAARVMLKGCRDYAPFLAIQDTLDFWERETPEAIRARLLQLQRFVEQTMAEKLGWTCISPEEAPFRGPLLSYRLPPYLEKQSHSLAADLFREGLQISTPHVGRPCLRISPHVYNTEEEILKGIEVICGCDRAKSLVTV